MGSLMQSARDFLPSGASYNDPESLTGKRKAAILKGGAADFAVANIFGSEKGFPLWRQN